MVNDMSRLRAVIFERTGIAVEEKDPIMAVLVASSCQAEEIGSRLLRRTSPVRVVLASSTIALLFGAICSWATWQIAQSEARVERTDWLRQQADPRTAALLRSEQGRAALRLAELRVANILANCSGRPSWQVIGGYCIPKTSDGKPDGFTVAAAATSSR
jgi:hypothetical protein